MSERTRRQFIGSVGSAAAVTVLAPQALAAAGSRPSPAGFGGASSAGGTSAAASTPVRPPYSSFQSEIFLGGATRGTRPKITTNLSDLEAEAAAVLSPKAQRHLLAVAGGRRVVLANARAFSHWRIVPRMFRDHAVRDLSTTVLGSAMPAPVIFAPVGRQRLAHQDGELGSARAAADLGLTYVRSADASSSPEDVAAANGAGSRWYELDLRNGNEPDVRRLARARAARYTHLVVALPSAGADWKRVRSVRATWDGPTLLRGIQTVEEARRAVKNGIEGIVVSNHAGVRKGAESRGTLDALPAIAKATGKRLSVLFDSGVHTAPEAFKALALGADAVLVGRPYVFGLALDGQAGVTHVMRTLLAELDISLGNAGYATRRDLGRASVASVR